MEAVPRLPMIDFELKTSKENPDFNNQLRKLIAGLGEDPSGFDKEIKEIESLRANSCIRPSESVEGVATAKKYYCQLLFLKNKFNISSESPFQFSWYDIYFKSKYSSNDIKHELASVLYNIGALHSKLGSQENRQESDGMKMAVAHLQCAAYAFHALPDMYPQESDSDMSSELLAFKSGLCLAQAQECICEKSLLDNRKPGIIAKVAGQVVEYYKQVLKQLEMNNVREMNDHVDNFFDVVGSKQSRIWRIFLEFKISYYISLSYLHMGMASEENGKWGERVAYYSAASTALALAAKTNKDDRVDSLYKGVNDALIYTNDVVNGKLEISKKENEFIYHEKVPDVDSLPAIKGASLVKGIPFDPTDPEVSGGDLFSRIVTLETHAASSMYSEELAKMLRQVCGEIEGANDSLVLYLSSLQLEDIPNTESLRSLPSELIECAAGLSVRPQCVTQLQQAMAKLASVSADVEASLQEIQEMLKVEERQEEEFSAVMGPRPKPIMAELERETQKYHAAHSMASESNLTLHTAMQLHVKNLKLLSQSIDDLASLIPTLDQLDEKTLSSLDDMRKIMLKVDEMRNQRTHLELELRNAVQNDDITGRIAAKGNNDNERMFEDELKKHDKIISYIRQNISAQTAIVQAMTERNADYADARYNVDKVMKDREETVGQLVASYHAYEDLLNKTTKGLEFYDKLDGNVSKLLDRVKGVVKVQDEERNQIMQSSEKKAAEARALSLSLIAGTDPKLNFKPEAPPQTPDVESKPVAPSVYIPPPSTIGPSTEVKPRLGDYLSGGYKPPSSTLPQQTGSPNRRPRLGDYLNERKGKFPEPGVNQQQQALVIPTPQQHSGHSAVHSTPQQGNTVHAPEQPQQPQMVTPNPYTSNQNIPHLQPPTQQFIQPSDNQDATIPPHPQPSTQHPSYQTPTPTPLSQGPAPLPPQQQPTATPTPFPINQVLPRHAQPQQYHNSNQPPHQHNQKLPTSNISSSMGQGPPHHSQPKQQQQLQDQHYPAPYFPTSQAPQHQQTNNYHPTPAPFSQASQAMSNYQQPQQQQQYPTPVQFAPQTAGYHQQQVQTQNPLHHPTPQMPQQQATSHQGVTPQQIQPQPNFTHAPVQPTQPSNNPTIVASNIAQQQQPSHASFPSYQQPIMVPLQNQQISVSQPIQSAGVPQHFHGNPATGMFQQLQQQLGANSYIPPAVFPHQSIVKQPNELGKDSGIANMSTNKEASNLTLLSDLTTSVSEKPKLEPAVPMPGTSRPSNKPTANIEPVQSFQREECNQVKAVPVQSEEKNVFTEVELLKKYQTIEKFLGELQGKGVDELWKEVLMRVDTLQKKKETVSVAKLYPFDNRSPDILPYDYNRVTLKTRDDYINASYIEGLENMFIVTQSPLVKKQSDYWSMIWEDGVEIVMCLATDQELTSAEYLPSEMNRPCKVGDYSLVVQSLMSKNGYFERVLVLHNDKLKQTRALMHIQLVATSMERTLPFLAQEMNVLRKQQRSSNKPILVHCLDGGERSGCFLVLNSLVTDLGLVDDGHWPVVKTKVSQLITQRKGIFREKTILKLIYHSLLNYLGTMIGGKEGTAVHAPLAANDGEDFVGVSVASLKAELQPVIVPSPRDSSLDHDVTDIPQPTGDTPVKSNFSQIEDELTRSPLQNIPADLSKLVELKLDDGNTKKNKITKDDFNGPSKTIVPESDPSDPFSQLDPLWSMKK